MATDSLRRNRRRRAAKFARDARRRACAAELYEPVERTLIARRIGPDEVNTRYRAALSQWSEERVRISGSSRFVAYSELLGPSVNGAGVADTDATQAKLEAEMLATIHRNMPEGPERETWLRDLNKLASGPLLPGRKHDPGRDFQAELFTAAILRQAGLEVYRREPDLRVDFGKESFGLAVKRVSTFDSLGGALRKAVAQIRESGMNGAAWLDVTAALGNPIATRKDDIFADLPVATEELNRFVVAKIASVIATRDVARLVRGNCHGIVAIAHAVVVGSHGTAIVHMPRFVPFGRNRTSHGLLKRIALALKAD